VLTRRLDPQRARLEHLDRERLRVPPLNLRHARPHAVPRQAAPHEDDEPVQPGDAVPTKGQRLDGELELLITRNGRRHPASLARGYSRHAMRICSLLPSATEIVGHLGLVDSLVGVSEECDWPAEVRELPVVTASRVDPASLTSSQIDAAVREAVTGGRSLYALDEALLAELVPDVILTQDLCPCAPSPGTTSRRSARSAPR
jgi:hypothetical protein